MLPAESLTTTADCEPAAPGAARIASRSVARVAAADFAPGPEPSAMPAPAPATRTSAAATVITLRRTRFCWGMASPRPEASPVLLHDRRSTRERYCHG